MLIFINCNSLMNLFCWSFNCGSVSVNFTLSFINYFNKKLLNIIYILWPLFLGYPDRTWNHYFKKLIVQRWRWKNNITHWLSRPHCSFKMSQKSDCRNHIKGVPITFIPVHIVDPMARKKFLNHFISIGP